MGTAALTVIRPHLLLDVVTGELLTDRAVVIDGHRIAGVVAAGDAPAEGPAFVDLPGQTVLPGMIDCHTHLVGEPDSGHGYAELLARTGAQEALSGARNARSTPCWLASPRCVMWARSAPSSMSPCAMPSTKAGWLDLASGWRERT